MTRLEEIAPRIGRAHREMRERLAARRDDELRLERLVAHRELQLARACARPGRRGRYWQERALKLRTAQAALERLRRRPTWA